MSAAAGLLRCMSVLLLYCQVMGDDSGGAEKRATLPSLDELGLRKYLPPKVPPSPPVQRPSPPSQQEESSSSSSEEVSDGSAISSEAPPRAGRKIELKFTTITEPYTKRKLKRISNEQRDILIEAFAQNPKPSRHQYQELARRTQLPAAKVRVWFQHRRAAQRKRS